MFISKINDIVRYNGNLDCVDSLDKNYIEGRLKVGNLCTIIQIDNFSDGVWYSVEHNGYRLWIPIQCIDIINIKERYGLR